MESVLDRSRTRDERVEAAAKKLEEGVEAITSSEEFTRYLRFVSSFHNYSSSNVLLIMMARPGATRVAGYRRWQSLHRQVRRGQEGIAILAPITRKITDDDGEMRPIVVGFKTVKVFDISQTYATCEEGEVPAAPAPVLLTSNEEAAGELLGRLEGVAAAEGVSVEYAVHPDIPQANGTYDPRSAKITIHPDLPAAARAKTLAHELAHHFTRTRQPETEALGQREHEAIAEGTAFVVCEHLGLDSSDYSFAYVARWSGKPEVVRGVAGHIQKAAYAIIEGVEGRA